MVLGKHLHEIEALPARELTRWIAYFRVEPMPDIYVAAAVGAHSTALSAWSGRGQAPAFDDFLVKTPPPPETDAERVERLKRQFGIRDDGENASAGPR